MLGRDSLSLPRPFGPYTLHRRIAVGGMAEVYVATTLGLGGFEKAVAIKVIHPRLSEDDHFIQMLVDEAKLSVLLSHPNIVQTFDLGCIDETYFIVMELIEGADAFRLLRRAYDKRARLPLDLCAFIVAEMCQGLEYAHTRTDSAGTPLNIVHRDISPQNVLISFSGQVKLVDFGIAKAAQRNSDTGVGVIKGKYSYMSPEQAWADPVDGRSDIFSTGVVLYELITGEMLYQQENLPLLLDAVREADIPPPSSKRRDVPPELDAICMRALAPEPGARYPSAAEFGQALLHFLHRTLPTFTPARLAQLMAALFPEQGREGDATRPHTVATRAPGSDTTAAPPRVSSPSDSAPPGPARAPTSAPTNAPSNAVRNAGGGASDSASPDTQVGELKARPTRPLRRSAPPAEIPPRPPLLIDLSAPDDDAEELTETHTELGMSEGPPTHELPAVSTQNLAPAMRPDEFAPAFQASVIYDFEQEEIESLLHDGAALTRALEDVPPEPNEEEELTEVSAELSGTLRSDDVASPTATAQSAASGPAASPPAAPTSAAPTSAPPASSPPASSPLRRARANDHGWDDATSTDPGGDVMGRIREALERRLAAERAGVLPGPAGRPRSSAARAGEESPSITAVAASVVPPIVPASVAPPPVIPASVVPPPVIPASVAPPPIVPASVAPPVVPASVVPPPTVPASVAPPIVPASVAPPVIPASVAPRPELPGDPFAPVREDPTERTLERPPHRGDPFTTSHDLTVVTVPRRRRPWLPVALALGVIATGATAWHLGRPQAAPLRERSARVEVRSVPPGASVELDGRRVGTTPLTIDEVPDARAQLVVIRSGYERWETTLDPDQPRDRVVAVLRQQRRAIRVESTPSEASVFVDGDFRGQAPLDLGALNVGREYRLELQLPGHRPTRRSFDPGELRDGRLQIDLPPR